MQVPTTWERWGNGLRSGMDGTRRRAFNDDWHERDRERGRGRTRSVRRRDGVLLLLFKLALPGSDLVSRMLRQTLFLSLHSPLSTLHSARCTLHAARLHSHSPISSLVWWACAQSIFKLLRPGISSPSPPSFSYLLALISFWPVHVLSFNCSAFPFPVLLVFLSCPVLSFVLPGPLFLFSPHVL